MAAKKAVKITKEQADWLKTVFNEGYAAANERFNYTDEQAREIFTNAGFEASQIDVIARLPGLEASAIIDPANIPQPLKDIQQQASQAGDRSFDIFVNRGVSPETSFQRDRLREFQSGATTEQQILTDIGGRLTTSEGRTAESDALRDRGFDLINTGGRARAPGLEEAEKNALAALGREDPGLVKIREAGMALVKSGGFTPELRNLLGQATNLLGVVGTGGMTPQLQEVFDQAIGLVKSGGRGGALLPFDQVLQNAREEAAFAINSQVNRAVREASARGGFQGGLVAGAAASPLAEFADQASEIQARAVRDAAAKQQALQLQQLQTGFQAAGGAAAAGAQREASLASIGAGLAGDVARSASANLNTGASTALGAQQAEVARQNQVRGQLVDIGNAFTNREVLGANMVGQASNMDLARLQTGAGMLGTSLQSRQNASQLLNDLSSIEAQRESMGLQGFLNAGNQQMGAISLGTGIQQQNFNNQMGFAAFLESLRQQDINNQLAALNMVNNQGNAFLNFASNTIPGITALTQSQAGFQAQPGMGARILEASIPAIIAGGASAAIGGFSNIPGFGGGGGGGFDPSFGQGG